MLLSRAFRSAAVKLSSSAAVGRAIAGHAAHQARTSVPGTCAPRLPVTRDDLSCLVDRHIHDVENDVMETEVAHAIVFDQAEDEMSNLLSMQTFLESRNHAGNVNSTSIQTHLAGIRQEKGQVLSKLDNVLQAADQHLLCQSELLHVLGACRDVLDAK